MAGEPLIEELGLDIQSALDAIVPLGDALTQIATDFATSLSDALASLTDATAGGTSEITVTADTTEVDAAIADALDAPRPPVDVEGDASGLADAIDAVSGETITTAVDADTSAAEDAIAGLDTTPVSVSVDADTSEAENAISGLDTAPVTISVDAETSEAENAIDALTTAATDAIGTGGGAGGHGSGAAGLGGAVLGIEAASGAARGEVGHLTGIIGGLSSGLGAAVAGGAAFTGFLSEVVSVAADAQAQEARFNDTFGDSKELLENINVGGLHTSLEGLSKDTGTLVADLENSATRIGLLGNAAGVAQPKVAATAGDLLGLAGALSVANPRLGDTAEVADTVSRALSTGRTRALIPYGISVSQTAIMQKALADNVGKTKDTLTGYDKLVAGLTLVLEQQGDTLGTKYAAGIQNAQVQLRGLKVSLEETLVAVGGPLLQPVVQSLQSVLPIAQSVGEVLGGLARDVLPAVQIAAFALTPIADVLHLIANGLNAIPTPLLAVAGGFITLSAALRLLLGIGVITEAVTGLDIAFIGAGSAAAGAAGGVGVLSGALSVALGPIGLAVAGLAIVGTVLGVFSKEHKEAKLDVEGMSSALFGEAEAANELGSKLGGLNSNLAQELAKNLATGKHAEDVTQAIHDLGISYDDLAKGVASSDPAFDAFLSRLDAQAPAVGLSADQVGKLDDALITQRKTLEASAGAQLDNLLATHQITQAQYDHIRSQNGINDAVAGSLESTGDYTAALKEATREAQAHEQATIAEGVATGSLTQAFLDLRPSIAAGTTTIDDAQQVADKLGITLDDAKAAIGSLKTAMDQFVSSGVQALPSSGAAIDTFASDIQSAFSKVASASKGGTGDVKAAQQELFAALDPQRAIDLLNQQTAQIVSFQANIDKLISEGFRNAAAALIVAGPEKGAPLAQSLVDDPAKARSFDDGQILGQKVREGYRTDLEAHKDELSGISVTLADGTIVPLADTLNADQTVPGAIGGLGTRGAVRFHEALVLRPGTALEAASHALATDPTVGQAAGQLGLAALRAYEAKFGPVSLAVAAQVALGGAHDAIAQDPTLSAAMGTKGTEATGALKKNIKPGEAAKQQLESANVEVSSALQLGNRMGLAGLLVGARFSTGIAQGIASHQIDVVNAADAVAAAAKDAAAARLKEQSPSRVGREIGANFTLGMALGITDATPAAEAAAESVSDATIARLQRTIDAELARSAAAAAVDSIVSTASGKLPSIGSDISQFGSDLASATTAQASALKDYHKAYGTYADDQQKKHDLDHDAVETLHRLQAAQAAYNAAVAAGGAKPSDAQKQHIADLKREVSAATSEFTRVGRALDSVKGRLDTDRESIGTAADTLAKANHALRDASDPVAFIHNLNQQTAAGRRFQADIAKLRREGFTDLATQLAEAGPEASGKLAASFASSSHRARQAEAAIDSATAFAESYTKFLEKQFAPKAADKAAAVGKLTGDALSDGLRRATTAVGDITIGGAAGLAALGEQVATFKPTVRVAVDTGAIDALTSAQQKPLPIPVAPVAPPKPLPIHLTAEPFTIPALSPLHVEVIPDLGPLAAIPDATITADVVLGPIPDLPAVSIAAALTLGPIPPLPDAVLTVDVGPIPEIGPLTVEVDFVVGALPEIPPITVDAVLGPVPPLGPLTADVVLGPLPPLDVAPLLVDVTVGPVPDLPPIALTAAFGPLPAIPDPPAVTLAVTLGPIPDLPEPPPVSVPVVFVPEVGGLAAQLAAVDLDPLDVDVVPHLLTLATLPPLDLDVTADVRFGPLPPLTVEVDAAVDALAPITVDVEPVLGALPPLPPIFVDVIPRLTTPVASTPLAAAAPVASSFLTSAPAAPTIVQLDIDVVVDDLVVATVSETVPVPTAPGATARLQRRVEAKAQA